MSNCRKKEHFDRELCISCTALRKAQRLRNIRPIVKRFSTAGCRNRSAGRTAVVRKKDVPVSLTFLQKTITMILLLLFAILPAATAADVLDLLQQFL